MMGVPLVTSGRGMASVSVRDSLLAYSMPLVLLAFAVTFFIVGFDLGRIPPSPSTGLNEPVSPNPLGPYIAFFFGSSLFLMISSSILSVLIYYRRLHRKLR